MFELGGWYLTGIDPDINGLQLEPCHTSAFSWIERSALGKHTKAMFALGYFYEQGIGCSPDINKATEWYEHAAEAGDKRALDWLKENKFGLKRKLTTLFKLKPTGNRKMKPRDSDCSIM